MRELPKITFIPLDSMLSEQASNLASQYGLRGADAVYAAVALEYGTTLISLDHEHLTRLIGIIPVLPPVIALQNLPAP